MRLLIYSGFNPQQKDNYGQTTLHLACINGNLTAVTELCEQVCTILHLILTCGAVVIAFSWIYLRNQCLSPLML